MDSDLFPKACSATFTLRFIWELVKEAVSVFEFAVDSSDSSSWIASSLNSSRAAAVNDLPWKVCRNPMEGIPSPCEAPLLLLVSLSLF